MQHNPLEYPQESQFDPVARASALITPSASPCTPAEMTAILSPAVDVNDVARVNCSFTYPDNPQSYMPSGVIYPGEITKGLEISRLDGTDLVGITFTCRGNRINALSGKSAVIVRSVQDPGLAHSVAHHITIQDCKIEGNVVVTGADETLPCTQCSSDPSESVTALRQSTAPHHVRLVDLDIHVRPGQNGVQFNKGVTYSSLSRSRVWGSPGRNTAVYLGPESGWNSIFGNRIEVVTENREQIAIDGSASNFIADNDFSALANGGIFIFRNCGESGQVRIQKPWNNSIVNNRFFYDTFNGSVPAISAASRTVWSSGHLVNTSDYCSADAAYNYGSGIDDFDNAKNTVVNSNQIRKGQNGLSVAQMVREPDSHDTGSLPFSRSGNLAVAELTTLPTIAIGAAGEPPPFGSLYFVQGGRLWRSGTEWGNSIALTASSWSGATAMATVGSQLYVVQGGVLNKVEPSGTSRVLTGATWPGPTTMTALNSHLYITQGGSLWSVDDLDTGNRSLLGISGYWPEPTSMTAEDGSLFMIEDRHLWRIDPNSGAHAALGTDEWAGPTTMTGFRSKLYVTCGGSLRVVDDLTTGAWHALSAAGDWQGATSMTNLDGMLYIIRGDLLWEADPTTGASRAIPRPHWDYSGPTVMAAMPNGPPNWWWAVLL